MIDHQGREPLGRLVEQQELGVPHQRSLDGQHLLLPPGEESAVAGRQLAQLRNVARRVEIGRVVRMDARGRKDESPVPRGIPGRRCRSREGFADADDRSRARLAGAGDYRVAVAGERRVREVGVAVDEDRRASVRRGHLRSIQRSTGAAT